MRAIDKAWLNYWATADAISPELAFKAGWKAALQSVKDTVVSNEIQAFVVDKCMEIMSREVDSSV